MNIDQPSVIIDDEPLLEREDRPRSRTWPILPPPIETIHEHERDAEIAEPPPMIQEEVEPEDENEALRAESNPRKNSRKNAWGNLSYADLITQAIQSSPEQRLTLSQIYEWMVRNIPYFKDKGDSTSSAGWKNSIRHNLSLHSRFMRVQNDNNGKSSYWVINPDAKPGKSSRRRSGSVDGQPKGDKKRIRNKKLHQSTDDISALSPGMKMNLSMKNRSYDNLFAPSPCSSTDSLSNLDDFHGSELGYPYAGESFARPRSTSNVSTQSSVNGRTTPPHIELDDMLTGYEDKQIGSSGVADDIESMTIEANSYNGTVPTTINLNDSMKLPPRRPHSDSFGSGDSGYESPAFPSPIQGQVPSTMQSRPTMNKLPSPNLVPNKPPPPYTTGYHNQMRPQPNMYNANYFPLQNQQQRMSPMNNQVPRLKHLPMANQTNFSLQPNHAMSNFSQQQRLPNNRTFSNSLSQRNTLQNSIFDSYLTYANAVIPNITVENKMTPFQQQQQQQQRVPQTTKGQSYNNDDIPMDLHQVKLFGFDDQQQLASDLDTIISNEMEASHLKSICEPYPNDTNNNMSTSNNTTTISMYTAPRVPQFPGQHWVR